MAKKQEQENKNEQEQAEAEQTNPSIASIQAEVQELVSQVEEAQRPIKAVMDLLVAERKAAQKEPRMLTAEDFEPVVLPLPSGAAVEVRPVDLEALALSGAIPQMLKEVAYKIAQSEDPTLIPDEDKVDKSLDDIKKMEFEATERFHRTLDIMTLNVVVKPELVDTVAEEGNGKVWVGRLTHTDKRYLMIYLTAPVVAFRAFR